jgi:hypothetical protein
MLETMHHFFTIVDLFIVVGWYTGCMYNHITLAVHDLFLVGISKENVQRQRLTCFLS